MMMFSNSLILRSLVKKKKKKNVGRRLFCTSSCLKWNQGLVAANSLWDTCLAPGKPPHSAGELSALKSCIPEGEVSAFCMAAGWKWLHQGACSRDRNCLSNDSGLLGGGIPGRRKINKWKTKKGPYCSGTWVKREGSEAAAVGRVPLGCCQDTPYGINQSWIYF